MGDCLTCPVEVRSSETGPRLTGVAIQEGRAARGGRRELFAPLSLLWPPDGVPVRLVHLGAEECRATVMREPDGRIRLDAPATPGVVEAVRTRPYLSVEFKPVAETRTLGGVREIERAVLTGAALVSSPEYAGTAVEVRGRPFKVYL